MAPRPFPSPLRIGMDICKIGRIRALIDPPSLLSWSLSSSSSSSTSSTTSSSTSEHQSPQPPNSNYNDDNHGRKTLFSSSSPPPDAARTANRFLGKLFTPRELAYFKARFSIDGGGVGSTTTFTSITTLTATELQNLHNASAPPPSPISTPTSPPAQSQPQLHPLHSLPEARKSLITAFVAGRWAAKEACVKAVKPRRLLFSDVEIWPYGKGGEVIGVVLDVADGGVREEKVAESKSGNGEGDGNTMPTHPTNRPSDAELDGQIVRVSISHDTEYACAVAMYGGDGGGSGGVGVVEDKKAKNEKKSKVKSGAGLEEEVKRLRREVEGLREIVRLEQAGGKDIREGIVEGKGIREGGTGGKGVGEGAGRSKTVRDREGRGKGVRERGAGGRSNPGAGNIRGRGEYKKGKDFKEKPIPAR